MNSSVQTAWGLRMLWTDSILSQQEIVNNKYN